MTEKRTYAQFRARRRFAYTFIELLVSLSTASIIVGGLSSSLYIAGRALEQDGTSRRASADQVLDKFISDVEHARAFTERTATAVTFSVPDRDGDGEADTIRYAWSGTPGDPLTYEYNGSPATTIAADVQNFNLSAMTRLLEATVIPPAAGGGKLLFVVADPTSLNAKETGRLGLMEGWGYAVTLIDDGESQANFDTAAADNDVVYVSGTISGGSLADKLTGSTTAIVNEFPGKLDNFGFCSDTSKLVNTAVFPNSDASHYISSPFSGDQIDVFTISLNASAPNGTLAPDIQVVAGSAKESALAALEAGAERYDSAPAPARRVHLPFASAETTQLTADGQSLMKRSIEWAAGAGGAAAGPLLLVVSDAVTPSTNALARQTLIESWGYTVTLIDDDATSFELAAAMWTNDVVYISQEITTLTTIGKFAGAEIGIVNEEYQLSNELGFGAGTGAGFSNDITITDNTHYITSALSIGPIALLNPTYGIYTGTSSTLAPGADLLGNNGSITGLMALETGASLHDGGNAAGRRVLVPWGADFAALNTTGQTVMRRAIEWASSPPDDGLVAHWKLDETSGTTAVDSLGGHDGTHENGPTLGLPAIQGLGARFDGIDDRVRVPDDPAFSSHTTTGLTVAAWVKVHAFDTDGNGQARQPIVSKGYWSDWEWALYIYDDGRTEFTTWQADGSAHSGSISTGVAVEEWVHIAGAIDPAVANRLYINGTEVASDTSFSGTSHDGTRDLFIARREDGQYLNATIDDVQIYARALDAGEISELAAAGGGGSGVAFRESTEAAASSNVTSMDVATPSGTAAGDLLIAAVATDGNTKSSLAAAGWNLINVEQQFNAVTFAVWWKIAGASEPPSQNFTWSGGQEAYGWISRYTGHDPSNPINASALLTTGSNDTLTPTSPATTTTLDGALIVRLAGFDDDDINIGDPGLPGHTAITMGKSGTGSASVSGGGGYVLQKTAGDSGTSTFTLTGMEQTVAITIAIAPAP